jgi:hypothetical protein
MGEVGYIQMPTGNEQHQRYANEAENTIKAFNDQQKTAFLSPLFGKKSNKIDLNTVSVTYHAGKSLFVIKVGKDRGPFGKKSKQINGEELSRLLQIGKALAPAISSQKESANATYGKLPKRKDQSEQATQEYGPVTEVTQDESTIYGAIPRAAPLTTTTTSSSTFSTSSTTPAFNPATTTQPTPSPINRENYNQVLRDGHGNMVDRSKADQRKSPMISSATTPASPKQKPIAGSDPKGIYGSMPSQPKDDKKNKP